MLSIALCGQNLTHLLPYIFQKAETAVPNYDCEFTEGNGNDQINMLKCVYDHCKGIRIDFPNLKGFGSDSNYLVMNITFTTNRSISTESFRKLKNEIDYYFQVLQDEMICRNCYGNVTIPEERGLIEWTCPLDYTDLVIECKFELWQDFDGSECEMSIDLIHLKMHFYFGESVGWGGCPIPPKSKQ